MKKYFIHNGVEQEGPFDIDSLRAKKITKSTSIWYEGLPEWITADKIEELKDLFKEVPPPYKTTPPPISNGQTKLAEAQKKKSKALGSIIKKGGILLAIVIGIIFVLSIFLNRHERMPEKSYESEVMTVAEMERSNPAQFLEVTGKVHENFWGDKIKIKGSVINKATVANFKDVVLEITFLSKTEAIIKTERYVLYDYVAAHSSKDFELKVTNWKATHSVSCVAVEATAY